MTEQPVIEGMEGPPCRDCVHAAVCSLKAHYEALDLDTQRTLLGRDLPPGLSLRMAVDCAHFLTVSLVDALEAATGGQLVHVNDGSGEARAMAWSEGYAQGFDEAKRPPEPLDVKAIEAAGSGDWLADAAREKERSQTEDDAHDEPDEAPAFNNPGPSLNDADATDEPPALQQAAPDVTPVAVKRARPIGAPTVVCDPGCGETILQAVIGEHRRTCPEVLAFKAARGVTQLPDRYLEPAAEAPTSDFAARRHQAARDAAARTWDRNHPEGDAPVVAAPPEGRPLAGQERRVLASALRRKGDRRAVAAELGIHAKTVESTLEHVGQKGHLPVELIQTLPARFAKYARVPA